MRNSILLSLFVIGLQAYALPVGPYAPGGATCDGMSGSSTFSCPAECSAPTSCGAVRSCVSAIQAQGIKHPTIIAEKIEECATVPTMKWVVEESENGFSDGRVFIGFAPDSSQLQPPTPTPPVTIAISVKADPVDNEDPAHIEVLCSRPGVAGARDGFVIARDGGLVAPPSDISCTDCHGPNNEFNGFGGNGFGDPLPNDPSFSSVVEDIMNAARMPTDDDLESVCINAPDAPPSGGDDPADMGGGDDPADMGGGADFGDNGFGDNGFGDNGFGFGENGFNFGGDNGFNFGGENGFNFGGDNGFDFGGGDDPADMGGDPGDMGGDPGDPPDF